MNKDARNSFWTKNERECEV